MSVRSSTKKSAESTAKTLYAQPSTELAARIERTKQLGNQSSAQVVLEAVDFWTLLPPEAHLALRRLEAASGRAVMERAVQHFARDLVGLQYADAQDRVVQQMLIPKSMASATSEDELLAAADKAVRRARSSK